MASFSFNGMDELSASFEDLCNLTDQDRMGIIMPAAKLLVERQKAKLAELFTKRSGALADSITIREKSDENGAYAELILPDSQRFINKEINELPMIGIINVQQDIYYNGETSTVEKNVIVCPIWFLVLLALTLMAIVWKIVKTVRKHKKKKTVQ